MRQYGTINNKPTTTQGFTLIELMIALVLGLLISAAVVQVYLSAFRTSSVQKSGSEIADASVFGIQTLERQIRRANLGNSVFQINQTTKFGGVVLAPENVGLTASNQGSFADALMTRSAGMKVGLRNQWTGVSGTDQISDQLTIQYQNVIGSGVVDCEGNAVNINDWVIERYFIRANAIFACDAGRVDTAVGGIKVKDTAKNVPEFGDAGIEFMDNVEQFKVLLGVQTRDSNHLGYLSPKDYLALTPQDKLYQAPIIAIKLGFLVRSDNVITEDTGSNYMVLNNSNTVTDKRKFLRRTYDSTIMLRNARVIVPQS